VTATPLGLYTDLYELTMAASFHRERRTETVTFDLFVRALPPRREFLVVAGIDTAVLTEGTRAVDVQPGDGDRALERMAVAGAHIR